VHKMSSHLCQDTNMGLMAPAPKVASDVVLRNIVSSMGGLSSKQALRRVRGVGDLAMNLLDEYSSSTNPIIYKTTLTYAT